MTISNMPSRLSAQISTSSVLVGSPEPIRGLITPQGLLSRLHKQPTSPRNLIDAKAAMQAETRYLQTLKLQSAEEQAALPPLKRTKSYRGAQDFLVAGLCGEGSPKKPVEIVMLVAPRPREARPASHASFLLPPGTEPGGSEFLPSPSAVLPSAQSRILEMKGGCCRELQSEGRRRSARLLDRWAESFRHRPRAFAAALKLALYLLPRLEYPNLKRLHFPDNLTLSAGFEDLEGLPPKLTVYGNLSLKNLPNFQDFGKKLHVHGDLVLDALPNLDRFPPCCSWKGGLRLASCIGLEASVENTPIFELF